MSHIQLITKGGWGTNKPAFAYDLTQGALVKGAKLIGVQRYGKKPSSSDEDTRPLGLGYRVNKLSAANVKAAWSAVEGNTDDLKNPNGSDADAAFLSYANSTPDQKAVFRTSQNFITQNSPFSISWFIYKKPKAATQILDWVRWGVPGAGYVFQVRDGKAEVGAMAAGWNSSDEEALRMLWTIKEPTSADEEAIASLKKSLYGSFDSLSLENSTGRDAWYDSLFTLSFIPEPRGVLHVVLEGADATAVENEKLLAKKQSQVLWDASTLEVGTLGGAMFWQIGQPRFNPRGFIDYGPLKTPSYQNPFSGLSNVVNYDRVGGTVYFDRVQNETLGAGNFGFRATLESNGNTPWLYGLSARTAPGTRNGGTATTFNSDDTQDSGNSPIKNLSIDTDANGRRTLHLAMRDIKGKTTSGKGNAYNTSVDALINRVADVFWDNQALLKNGLVVGGRLLDAKNYRFERGGTPGALSIDVSRNETSLELDIADGWHILDETICAPPPIGDGKKLGYHIREVLAVAGFTAPEMAGVGANTGTKLPKAAYGEGFAIVSDGDSSCGDVLRSLMDRFGYKLRFYQNLEGVWQLGAVSSSVQAQFKSKREGNSRYTILSPLDWVRDNTNFYNSFKVVGADGLAPQTWVIQESIGGNPNFPNWLGRAKPYKTLVDQGLNTNAAIQLALRSLVWRYGRVGKFAQFTTYFHPHLLPGDRVSVDGKLTEIDSIQGASASDDRMQLVVRELF